MTETNRQPGNLPGPGWSSPEDGEVGEISPDYARIQAGVAGDAIWNGPALDDRLRHFAAISAQCVGGFDPCLQDHIRAGMEHGITARQVKGIFIQLLFYAGIPATVHGLLQSQQVINEREEWQAADVPLEHDWLDTLQEKLERAGRLRTSLWGEDADREIQQSFAQRLTPKPRTSWTATTSARSGPVPTWSPGNGWSASSPPSCPAAIGKSCAATSATP